MPIPFSQFLDPAPPAPPLRRAITAARSSPEEDAVQQLLERARLPAHASAATQQLATRMVRTLRTRKAGAGRADLVQQLLQQYALSSQEGIALMCLAEALLRIPDAATRDALIRDKIAHGHWQAHLGKSPSLFVNAATWGLLLTGKLVATHSEAGLTAAIARLLSIGGEPVVRKGVDMAMRLMGEQFVTGETIAEALDNGADREAEGFTYSYDMLGEAALTAHDAQRYADAYESAIHAIGKAGAGRGIFAGPGISIKLSALHPRYVRSQRDRVMNELYPVLLKLCAIARQYDVGLNIDAEEADRLDLSLDLLERLCFEPALRGWNGLGFVVQAYQKRCPAVVDFLVDLAQRSARRLMVRLVKGAYWDSEIKRAQLDGLDSYPVYTRKPYTDVSYIACARKLLSAPEQVFPQFATHNAHTMAAIYHLAEPASWTPGQYEFQCLHGMGEPLYEQVVGPVADGKLGRPCRIYAPVGTHETLLAYLVRRLLENGANTSFVNRISDATVAVEDLIRDPVEQVEQLAAAEGAVGRSHPAIPLPTALYGAVRKNARGIDLSNEDTLAQLAQAMLGSAAQPWSACPLLGNDIAAGDTFAVKNPSDRTDVVGHARDATPADVDAALQSAQQGATAWAGTAPAERARMLQRAADAIEADQPRFMAMLIREAGKSTANAVAEVREAVDFLRYYAGQVQEHFDNGTHRPLGLVVCISPWNFPLAIFMGQVAAALAAGNVVLAKPAEQTPLVAAAAVRALWAAGVPRSAVQLLPGRGETVGAQLVNDPRVQGVLFTGSTDVARILQRGLAGRLDGEGNAIALIAETGGQNAMIVDSSALVEQVVVDVVGSAFDSAGQRCSALRVLCVQEEAADRVLEMLLGAMKQLRVGNPDRLCVDVGPVIDEEARANIERHIAQMRSAGHRVHQACISDSASLEGGTYVVPTLIELDSVAQLEREVFGPVLHFVRFRRQDLNAVIAMINGTGYGLTMGLHTRIDETIAQVLREVHAGNIYVNRNMVGAVVGVQPFGGEGLSGTGPKAGGPLYLYRLLSQCPPDVMAGSIGGDSPEPSAAMKALTDWAGSARLDSLMGVCRRFTQASRSGVSQQLPGPTGESNVYSLVPRSAVLSIASTDEERLLHLAAILAVGSRAVWPDGAQALLQRLPSAVRDCVSIAADWTSPDVQFESVLFSGSAEGLSQVQHLLAQRPGAIVQVERVHAAADVRLERLVTERSVSINTAAAGGNASLMAIG